MLPIVLILCIDVGTDMWPAIALAYEVFFEEITEYIILFHNIII